MNVQISMITLFYYILFFLDRRNAVVAMYILAVISTLIAFVFVTVYCVTDKYYFPVKRSAILFLFAGKIITVSVFSQDK